MPQWRVTCIYIFKSHWWCVKFRGLVAKRNVCSLYGDMNFESLLPGAQVGTLHGARSIHITQTLCWSNFYSLKVKIYPLNILWCLIKVGMRSRKKCRIENHKKIFNIKMNLVTVLISKVDLILSHLGWNVLLSILILANFSFSLYFE